MLIHLWRIQRRNHIELLETLVYFQLGFPCTPAIQSTCQGSSQTEISLQARCRLCQRAYDPYQCRPEHTPMFVISLYLIISLECEKEHIVLNFGMMKCTHNVCKRFLVDTSFRADTIESKVTVEHRL